MFLRGLTEEDFVAVADFFDRAVEIAQTLKQQTGPKLKDFKAALDESKGGANAVPALAQLRADVTAFARKFPTVGF